MSNFERIKFYYDRGWASVSQVRQYVFFKVVTPEEFEIITGETY